MFLGTALVNKLEVRAKRIVKELLSHYSPSGNESGVASLITKWAGQFGCTVKVDEAGNVLVWSGSPTMRPKVVLVSHMDTVPGIIKVKESGWVVYGRGAVDAKGPLAAMLLSLKIIKAAGNDANIMLAALVDEEGDSRGAWNLVDNGFRPEYVIIGEPTAHGVAISYRGSLKFRVQCRGAGGHSSAPWVGDSALDKLLSGLCLLRQATGNSFDKPSYTPVYVHARGARSKLPDRAEALIDARVPWGFKAENMVAFVKSVFSECRVDYKKGVEPVRVKPQDPVPRALIRALISFGIKPRLVHKTGTSDMNILWRCSRSIAAYGPGDSRLAHSNTEFIDVRDVALAALVYARAATWLSEEGGS